MKRADVVQGEVYAVVSRKHHRETFSYPTKVRVLNTEKRYAMKNAGYYSDKDPEILSREADQNPGGAFQGVLVEVLEKHDYHGVSVFLTGEKLGVYEPREIFLTWTDWETQKAEHEAARERGRIHRENLQREREERVDTVLARLPELPEEVRTSFDSLRHNPSWGGPQLTLDMAEAIADTYGKDPR